MTNNIIVEAILNKRLLNVTYNGATRHVVPHAYGLDKNGHGKLRVYQVDPTGVNTEHAGWRMFNEEAIEAITTSDEEFASPYLGYKRDDKTLATIFAQL